MIWNATYALHTNIDEQRQEVSYIDATWVRVLVRLLINLSHENDQIAKLFDEKIKTCINKLIASNLAPNDVLFRYQYY